MESFDVLNSHFIFVFTEDLPSISGKVTHLANSTRAFNYALFLFSSAFKTQAFVPSALKSRQIQKVYDIPNTLKDNQSSLIKSERLLNIDLQHEPVVVLVCPLCDPTGGHQKAPTALVFVIAEFLCFINATPEYETVFAEVNSADWKTPLADSTAAISMPLILDGGAINYRPTKLKFFLGITFVTALPKAMEYSTL
ncbi:unnamed protein product, partial [Allacma fusca]